jgi:hypothetical protein
LRRYFSCRDLRFVNASFSFTATGLWQCLLKQRFCHIIIWLHRPEEGLFLFTVNKQILHAAIANTYVLCHVPSYFFL